MRGLEALSVELFLEVNELLEYRERIAFSRTLEGRFFNLLGYGFAAYCVYKVIMTTIQETKMITKLFFRNIIGGAPACWLLTCYYY